MKKIFISQPMSGRTDEQIERDFYNIVGIFLLKNPFEQGEEIIFLSNFHCSPKEITEMEKQANDTKISNLVYLGFALKKMADCDGVIFASDYECARGCIVEEHVAKLYEMPTYYIRNDEVIYGQN